MPTDTITPTLGQFIPDNSCLQRQIKDIHKLWVLREDSPNQMQIFFRQKSKYQKLGKQSCLHLFLFSQMSKVFTTSKSRKLNRLGWLNKRRNYLLTKQIYICNFGFWQYVEVYSVCWDFEIVQLKWEDPLKAKAADHTNFTTTSYKHWSHKALNRRQGQIAK